MGCDFPPFFLFTEKGIIEITFLSNIFSPCSRAPCDLNAPTWVWIFRDVDNVLGVFIPSNNHLPPLPFLLNLHRVFWAKSGRGEVSISVEVCSVEFKIPLTIVFLPFVVIGEEASLCFPFFKKYPCLSHFVSPFLGLCFLLFTFVYPPQGINHHIFTLLFSLVYRCAFNEKFLVFQKSFGFLASLWKK